MSVIDDSGTLLQDIDRRIELLESRRNAPARPSERKSRHAKSA